MINLHLGALLLLVMSLPVAAQGPPSSEGRAPSFARPIALSTVEGCLQREGAVRPTPRPQAGRPPSAARFLLVDASVASPHPPQASRYVLIGHDNAVAELLNRRVQVDGHVDRPTESAPVGVTPVFHVAAIREAAGACAAGQDAPRGGATRKR